MKTESESETETETGGDVFKNDGKYKWNGSSSKIKFYTTRTTKSHTITQTQFDTEKEIIWRKII